MPDTPTRIQLDVAVIGGGIAGLWLANRLRQQGFNFALFERRALGSDQTIASQGMIHGGMKYTLRGAFTGASEAIADMPRHWRACLCGEGDVDLRNTRLLSDYFYLWSTNSASAKLTSFLASKLTRSRAEPVPDTRYPPLLRHADFGGNLYQLDDIVLDTHSLVTNLERNVERQCFLLGDGQAQWSLRDGEVVLSIDNNGEPLEIHAKRFVFCAGKGNGQLLAQLGLAQPAMQLRPLQQVLIKHHYPYSFYGHCLGADTSPRLTISSHRISPTEQVWYLGGGLSERGATMSSAELIEAAQADLNELLPWVNLDGAQWKTLKIERAEPLQPGFARPDNAFAEAASGAANLLVGWPTKLTLAPNLANQMLDLLAANQITPSDDTGGLALLQQHLRRPPIAQAPWQQAFPAALSPEEAMALRFTEPDDKEA